MADPEAIKDRLKLLISDGSPERLLALFVEELNFNPVSQDILSVLSERLKDGVQSMRLIAKQDEFHVVLCVIDRLLMGRERPIAENIAGRYPHSLVVFANPEYSEWHFTNIKYVKFEKEGFERKVRPFRRIIVGSAERLRTASDRLALTEVADNDSAIAVHERCNRAFDVQEVSREFYRGFVHYYKVFRDALKAGNRINDEAADALTQSIFNRLIFLYYIQKKNLLNENPTYLYDNFRPFDKLRANGSIVHGEPVEPSGSYYRDFLLPLFRKLSDPEFRDERLGDIPFLNGGLFESDPLEEKATVPNDVFKAVFEDLLERYNFTVREDTEFEQEVAIDPEMLGTIFEQLILSLEKAEFKDIPDARRQTGSYYTPKFIVAFMVKQSLLNYLAEAFPEKRRELKELVFSLETGDLAKDELRKIKGRLLDIKIIDPGVGSGAFPVGILLKMVEIIEAIDGIVAPEEVRKPKYRYELKLRIIENNIYGVDIQQRAVNLANLRLWLSLIVDLSAKSAKEVLPLPNLDYHIIRGDSLVSKVGEYDFSLARVGLDLTVGAKLLDKYNKLKHDYYEKSASSEWKQKQKERIKEVKREIYEWFVDKCLQKEAKDFLNAKVGLFTGSEEKKKLEREIKEVTDEKRKALLSSEDKIIDKFSWGLDFYEILSVGEGFDIVIGNPPYGVKVSDSVKTDFGLGNKDSYGVFTALGLKILRPGGTLCYIMSDTWQTIKTHKPLRDKLLSEADCQHIISCPSDTFGATVNVGVYTFKKRLVPKEGGENWILAADFSPLSIEKGEVEAAFEILTEQNIGNLPILRQAFDKAQARAQDERNEGRLHANAAVRAEPVEAHSVDGRTILSDREMAIFAYKQKLISRFSNHSFFIASPKLFGLMKDVGNVKNSINVNEPPVYMVEFNGKELPFAKVISLVEEICGGIKSYDNKKYIRSLNGDEGYEKVDESLILKRPLTDAEKKKGIKRRDERAPYYLHFDKGGRTINDNTHCFYNYFSPTEFFFPWDEKTVKELEPINALRNRHRYFSEGIGFTAAGVYSPLFRYTELELFQNGYQVLFTKDTIDNHLLLGVLCSKLTRFLFNVFINHTVNSNAQDVEDVPILLSDKTIANMVCSVIDNLKNNINYDYTNEQVEIDRLVYQMYNLNDDDVREVENWFFRRYPRLARVIEGKRKGKNALTTEKDS